MVGSGEEGSKTIRPEFNRSIMIDFQGAKITSDTGFLLLREIDDRFRVIAPRGGIEGTRTSPDEVQRPAHEEKEEAASRRGC